MSKPRSRDMELDPGTFGGSPACHIVVDMLNNNIVPVKEKHRILAFINDAIRKFKWLSTLQAYDVKERAMILMKNDFFDRIDHMSYPEKLRSHLKCVVTHHFRRYLKIVVWTIAP